MTRQLAAAAMAATLILGGGCSSLQDESPTDELRRLRAENKALREQNETFAARLGLPPTAVVPATRPVAPPGDVAVGMSLETAKAIADRDGLRFERVGPPPAAPGEGTAAETWRLSKVVDVFIPPPGTIERRFNAGYDRAQVKEKTEWTKLVRVSDGHVSRIDPIGG